MRITGRQRLRRLIKSRRGAVLAEIAIVLPAMILLLGAAAELGRFFYIYTTLAKATRAGARYLSSGPYKDKEGSTANMVVCGKVTDCGSETIISGFDANDVVISRDPEDAAVPQTVTVGISADFTYTPVFDLGRLMGGEPWVSLPLRPSTTMRYIPTTPFS
jgi:Flp pilus assembly protein TadG